MQDEGDASGQIHRFEPGIEITGMIDKTISLCRGFSGLPHADEVGRKAASVATQIRNDVAPEIGRSRVAVEKYNRLATSYIDVAYLCINNLDASS